MPYVTNTEYSNIQKQLADRAELLEACKKCYDLLYNGIKQGLVKELEQAISKAERT